MFPERKPLNCRIRFANILRASFLFSKEKNRLILGPLYMISDTCDNSTPIQVWWLYALDKVWTMRGQGKVHLYGIGYPGGHLSPRGSFYWKSRIHDLLTGGLVKNVGGTKTSYFYFQVWLQFCHWLLTFSWLYSQNRKINRKCCHFFTVKSTYTLKMLKISSDIWKNFNITIHIIVIELFLGNVL